MFLEYTIVDLIAQGFVALFWIGLIAMFFKSKDFSDGNVGSDDDVSGNK